MKNILSIRCANLSTMDKLIQYINCENKDKEFKLHCLIQKVQLKCLKKNILI